MSDIVWSIDARNDSTEDMVSRMKDYAFNTLVEQDVSVDFKVSGFEKSRKMDIVARQNIFSIFKEAINNIIKHAKASEVRVYLDNSGSRFVMRITDNGTGFDDGSVRKGNGLGNMRMRAERMGGKLVIISQNGTVVELSMKPL
jgi:signal transduction histidine kinase